jgi:hypothetical protein
MAQRELIGRSAYFSDENLRAFESRILHAQTYRNRKLLGVVESVRTHLTQSRRGKRFVIFDTTGAIIEKSEASYESSEKAVEDMEKIIEKINVIAVTLQSLRNMEAMIQRRINELAESIQKPKAQFKQLLPGIDQAADIPRSQVWYSVRVAKKEGKDVKRDRDGFWFDGRLVFSQIHKAGKESK